MHAPPLNLCGLRILILVDHIFIHTLVHQFMDFWFRPGLAKSCEVLPRVSVEHQFVVDDGVDMSGIFL